MRWSVAVLIMIALTGCSLGNMPTPRATYAPVPDARLLERLALIPGVTHATLRWSNGFDNPNGYHGSIDAGRGADAAAILDRALALLRQGRPGADLGGIHVAPASEFAVWPTDFGLWTQADYTARYGPQPGTGLPPSTPLIRTR